MKNILVFGASGYVARHFCDSYSHKYHIVEATRKNFDFLYPEYDNLVSHLIRSLHTSPYLGLDGILFLQGINPRAGVDDIDEDQFQDMLSLNLSTPLQIIRRLRSWINKGAAVVFASSIAREKGSYDPSYASAKAGLVGLQGTLSNHFPDIRFNTISLGLIEGSPVHREMTSDFEKKHLDAMGGDLVKIDDVCKTINFLIECNSISRAIVSVDRGFRL